MRKISSESYYDELITEDKDLSWLEIRKMPKTVFNWFTDRPDIYSVEPAEEMVELCQNEEYLHFTCKHILNINLLPFQVVIIKKLWTKRMPMLVGCRGLGKTFLLAVYALLRALLNQGSRIVIVGAGFRQAKQVFQYVERIWENAPVLREIIGTGKNDGPKRDIDRCYMKVGSSYMSAIPIGDGTRIRGERASHILADEVACLDKDTIIETASGMMRISDCSDIKDIELFTGDSGLNIEKPDTFIKTKPTDVYEIKTKYGYTFKCSKIHKVKTVNGFKLAKDLTTDDSLVFKNDYIFPQKEVEHNGTVVNLDLAWLMGILTAEGSINGKYDIYLKSTDIHVVDKVEEVLLKFTNKKICRSTVESYKDKRGWECKCSYVVRVSDLSLRERLCELGLHREIAINKKVPWSILKSPKDIVCSYLSGAFDGDGSCYNYKDKHGILRPAITYYTASEQLAIDIQTILAKINIVSARHSRESKISSNPQWMVRVSGHYVTELSNMLNIDKWKDTLDASSVFKVQYPGTTLLKECGRWRANLYYNKENIYIGLYSTQQEAYDACVKKRDSMPMLMPIVSVKKLYKQDQLYDFHLPITHSFYGNCFNQHNSINEEIFNVVIRGFGIVSQDPVQKVKEAAKIQRLKEMGAWTEEARRAYYEESGGNQIVYSGTAYYTFNHFYKWFKIWETIIESQGDPEVIKSNFGDDFKMIDGFNWKDYCIMRVPYTAIPDGFLDEGMLAQSRATMHTGQFLMEYGAVFPMDTDGFYKRSLIESCTTNKPIKIGDEEIQFIASMRGSNERKYVVGVDAAALHDNASITVLELHETHRRIVFNWATNKKDFDKRRQAGLSTQDNYYKFIARKILDLFYHCFPIERIEIDQAGGGTAVIEALGEKNTLLDGELPLYPVIDENDEQFTDSLEGYHIIHPLKITSEYNSESNHGLKKDMQEKAILFPKFDTVEIARASIIDNEEHREFDTYEECVMDIEELKNETATIVMTSTSALGREHFDTPEIKVSGQKKGRLRKDRFCSMLYANFYARNRFKEDLGNVQPVALGAIASHKITKYGQKTKEVSGKMYVGPGSTFINQAGLEQNHGFYRLVRKN